MKKIAQKQNVTDLIDKMHEYLSIFRKLAKYSSEELGNEIGVSRTTIVNFERNVKEIRMSKAQYIALRTVLEARADELLNQKNDNSLDEAIKLVFYNPDYEEKKLQIKELLTTAGAICGVAGSISIGTLLSPVFGSVLTGVGIGVASAILKGLKDKGNKEL